MPAYVKMKDFTSHYQNPADCTEGISWPSEMCYFCKDLAQISDTVEKGQPLSTFR